MAENPNFSHRVWNGRMKRKTKIRIASYALILAIPAAWLVSEFRWSRINNPQGKFDSVASYLSSNRQPSRVKRIEREGTNYFIAYSPMDTWLAVPSGPAAYVFRPDGKMIDSSWDTGDDPAFGKRWPYTNRVDATVEEMKMETFQQNKD